MSERFERHVPGDDLALYVMGGLDGGRCDAVEAHVMVCEGCADALAREARFETAFDEVARRAIARGEVVAFVRRPLAPHRPARRTGRFMGGVVGALAAAAATVLMFAETSRADPAPAALGVTHATAYDGAAGDMSGALMAVEVRSDKLDGG